MEETKLQQTRTNMPYFLCIFLLLSVHFCAATHCGKNETASRLMICYYTATSYFPASQVPANLCTHIIYAFAAVTKEGIKPLSSQDIQNYKTLIQLKQKVPSLKVLLSLQQGFPSIVNTDTAVMKSFAQSAVKFLSSYGFDGVDLDWEYPRASDKDNFQKFIEIFHGFTSSANMLMSAALPNSPVYFKGYDVNSLSRCLDFMTAMTYDFHMFIKNVDNTTGYNSPLFTPKRESLYSSTSAVMSYYLQVGIPANKLLVGIPLYGRSWILASPSKHDLHAPAIGKGGPGPYRGYKGIYTYPDVCVAIQQGAETVLDNTNGASYMFANTTWVSYEGIQTIKLKLSWMKSQNLAGVGVWAMHLDDNVGVCKSGILPLLSAIKSNL